MAQKGKEENRVRKEWEEVWSDIEKGALLEPEKDVQSSLVFETIRRISRDIKNRDFLEAGSGLGFASLRTSMLEGNAVLLDVHSRILQVSKRFFLKRGLLDRAHFITGSISHLPFRNASFDMVWNSGVLEHFGVSKQMEFLSEMTRVLKPGGVLAIIVPNRNAFFYNLSRILLQKIGSWGYGHEEPFSAQQLEEILTDQVAGFEILKFAFSFQFRFLPGRARILVLAKKILEKVALVVEITLTKLLGHSPQLEGYLIAGYGIKKRLERRATSICTS